MTTTLLGWAQALGQVVLGVTVSLASLWSRLLRTSDFLDWVKALNLAPAFIALAVLIVTANFYYWQVRLAKQKLRHDLYDRRFAIYRAFRELLIALPDKSSDTIKRRFRRAGVARFEARFLLDDPQIEDYLEDLYKQVNENVIRHIYFLEHMDGVTMNDQEIIQDVGSRHSQLVAAKYNLADRHLAELSQQFERFLKLTDFWKLKPRVLRRD
jgi:hypothetical protein